MKKSTFKDWDLDQLDNAFGLKQIWESDLLAQWENNAIEVNEIEKMMLLQMQKSLIRGGRSWNEVELETKQPPAKAGGFKLRTESPDTRRLNDVF